MNCRNKCAAVYYHKSQDGQVLYVGMSFEPFLRFQNHLSTSKWSRDVATIELKWFETRKEARAFERKEIQRLKPPHNGEWQKCKGHNWYPNEGHVYIANWMRDTGATEADLASRSGLSVREATDLASTVKHIRAKKARVITIATDGYVPHEAWEASRHHWRAPILRMPTPSEARENAIEAVERLMAWGDPLPPRASHYLSAGIHQ